MTQLGKSSRLLIRQLLTLWSDLATVYYQQAHNHHQNEEKPNKQRIYLLLLKPFSLVVVHILLDNFVESANDLSVFGPLQFLAQQRRHFVDLKVNSSWVCICDEIILLLANQVILLFELSNSLVDLRKQVLSGMVIGFTQFEPAIFLFAVNYQPSQADITRIPQFLYL